MRRELPSGGVADGYQSNPIQSVSSASPHGKSFLLLSHPARKLVHLSRTTRCGESTGRASILGLSERRLQGRLESRGYERVKRRASVAPIASLCHHPSMSIFGPSVAFNFLSASPIAHLYNMPTCNVISEIRLVHRLLMRRILALFRCSLRDLRLPCRSCAATSASAMTEKIHVHPRIRFPKACSFAGIFLVTYSRKECGTLVLWTDGVYRATAQSINSDESPSQYSTLQSRY